MIQHRVRHRSVPLTAAELRRHWFPLLTDRHFLLEADRRLHLTNVTGGLLVLLFAAIFMLDHVPLDYNIMWLLELTFFSIACFPL